MQALRNSTAICLFLAGLGLAQAPAPDSAKPESPRQVERYERESPYRKAVRAHYADEIGVGAGLSTGNGLSYRHWFSDAWGVQVNLLPFYNETQYPSSNGNDYPQRDSGFLHSGYFSAGLTGLHEFARTDALRFIGYLAGSVTQQYTRANYYYQGYDYSRSTGSTYGTVHDNHTDWSNDFAAGAGFGLEFYVWRFCLSPMLGYRGSYDIATKEKQVGPTAEGAAYFRF